MLVGQTRRSVEDVTKKKERRSADCISAHVGRRSETRSQKNCENGSNGQDLKERLEVAMRNHVIPSE